MLLRFLLKLQLAFATGKTKTKTFVNNAVYFRMNMIS
jgi:hypothetical protein